MRQKSREYMLMKPKEILVLRQQEYTRGESATKVVMVQAQR